MYRSSYYEMTSNEATRVVVLRRTAEPYASDGQLRAEVDGIVQCFEPKHAAWGIVVDMRDAPPRNDPAFEAAMRRLRFQVGQAFRKVLVVVSTASGEMQVTRLHREGGHVYGVMRDFGEAIVLAGNSEPPPVPASVRPSSPWPPRG